MPVNELTLNSDNYGRSPRRSVDAWFIRLADVVISTCTLFFVSPLILFISALIYLEDGRSPIFGQTRIGRHGFAFTCLKLRTMAPDAETRLAELLVADQPARFEWERDHKLKNDPRITRIGTFLRKSSLDELPQLLNVLAGHMSLVGPRPIVASEIAKYGQHFPAYCSVRPGITGLWQVSGRNDVSYQRRIAMDVAYSRGNSFALYCKLLAKTIPAVLLRKGSY